VSADLKLFVIILVAATLGLLSTGCTGDSDDDESENGKVWGEYSGRNSQNETIIRVVQVENAPYSDDVYAAVKDGDGNYVDWHAWGENPGVRHRVSKIKVAYEATGTDEKSDIGWKSHSNPNIRPDEEFFISADIVPPESTGYRFLLEYESGKNIMEVEIPPMER